jgi:hypothetical protein
MLWRIFGPKREEVVGSWGKLYNKELHNLYSLSNIIRVIKSRMMRLVRKPKGKRPLGRPRHR